MAIVLKILHGIGQGQALSVPNDQPVTLGRSTQASYAFDDPLLSRKHCAVECRGTASRVVDLQSRNGTFVNGQRIAAPQLLKAGDRIKIGSILMEVTPVTAGMQLGPVASPGVIIQNVGASHAAAAPAPAVAPAPQYPAPPQYPATAAYATPPQYAAPPQYPPPPQYAPPPSQYPPQPMAAPPAIDFGATLPAPLDAAAVMAQPQPMGQPGVCEACRRTIAPHEVRQFKGRVVCPRCLDRYDVDEDMLEGFKIIERLAQTSTGTVYKAKQLLMGRLVMLKTIVTSGGQTDQKALRRFMREAKAGGRLSHPSIIELYDVNEQGEMMYIVMEFIEGETLEAMLKAHGPLTPPSVVRYMSQIGDALKYAHEQQIIHRDIRPATIMVRKEDDRAKLTDFTLAKNLERAAFSVITADGEAIGTPYYMPPEQVKSAKAADARSDIYSYCAAFYHVLSGKFPIEARSYGEFITKVFSVDAPQLKDVAPGVPPKLANLIQKGLSRDPNHRWQDMDGLLQELVPIQKAVGAAG